MINIVPSSRTYGPYCYRIKLYDIIHWGNLGNPYTFPGSLTESEWDWMIDECKFCQLKAELLNRQLRIVSDPLKLDYFNPKYFGPEDEYQFKDVYEKIRSMKRYGYDKVQEEK